MCTHTNASYTHHMMYLVSKWCHILSEDELLDAIGYDPGSNSVFMRDRMLAVMSFSLREGSLQLSDTSGEFSILGPELITEICFSNLLFKLDYRPKMKFFKLDASLHSITMVDHLHPDSLFPTLVQPKGSTVCNVYCMVHTAQCIF